MSRDHALEDFQVNKFTTEKAGAFDVNYSPSSGWLDITVRCVFEFNIDEWGDEEKEAYKQKFLELTSRYWSNNKVYFYCQRDWWEHIAAKPRVSLVEVDDRPHFAIKVERALSNMDRGGVASPDYAQGLRGHADVFDQSLSPMVYHGISQVPALHEAGHMLGLCDLYLSGNNRPTPRAEPGGTPTVVDWIESELDTTLVVADDERIMACGEKQAPHDFIGILLGLRAATETQAWGIKRKTPRSVP